MKPIPQLIDMSEVRTKDAKVISVVSHNLKGPLSYVHHMISFLNENWDSLSEAEKRDTVKVLEEASLSMYQLLKRLLDWSKLQLTNPDPVFDTFNVKNLLDEIHSVFVPFLQVKSLNWKVDAPEGLKIHTDPNILEIILQNILTNAIKYTKKDGVVSVSVYETLNHVVFEVVDQGIGMTKAELKRLEEGISGQSKPGTMGERGSGLGLLIVRDFLELLGGSISIDSQHNKGTTVKIFLPKKD